MNDLTAYLDNMRLLSTIGVLLAGFCLSIVFQFIRSEDRTKLVSLPLFVLLTALGCFVVSVFNSVSMVIGSNTSAFISEVPNTRKELPLSLHLASSLATLSFLLGLFLFTCGIGCSGWLHSRAPGLLSTAIAGVTSVATLGVFTLMIFSI